MGDTLITDSVIKVIENSFNRRKYLQGIAGQFFNDCFKEIKWIKNNGDNETIEDINSIFGKVAKEEIIIFSPDYKKITEMPEVTTKIVFPFDKVFIEYPLTYSLIDKEKEDVIAKIANGFYLQAIRNDLNEITAIVVFSIITDYGSNRNNPIEEGVKPFSYVIPYRLINNSEIPFPEDATPEEKLIFKTAQVLLKKICYLMQNKEYDEYFKWTPTGVVKKQIVYSHDVKSHKRHFWSDSGKFKIPLMDKEELISKGYNIDECVFRGYELRRDVPYKIINSYKVGEEKVKEDNRIINLLKKRKLKNEEKLGSILLDIFKSNIIRRHDRKMIKPFELDFFIYDLKLAFEYDGEQHFDKKICEEVFKCNFECQRQRDIKKNAICRKNKITLIRIKYDEPLTKTNIQRIITSRGINI